MTEAKPHKSAAPDASDAPSSYQQAKKERLAKALRTNLLRRKSAVAASQDEAHEP